MRKKVNKGISWNYGSIYLFRQFGCLPKWVRYMVN